jgi:hypothetical protein
MIVPPILGVTLILSTQFIEMTHLNNRKITKLR